MFKKQPGIYKCACVTRAKKENIQSCTINLVNTLPLKRNKNNIENMENQQRYYRNPNHIDLYCEPRHAEKD